MDSREKEKPSIFKSGGFWLLIIGILFVIAGVIIYFTDLITTNYVDLIVGGIGLILLIIGIILLIRRGGNKKKENDEEDDIMKDLQSQYLEYDQMANNLYQGQSMYPQPGYAPQSNYQTPYY